MTRNGFKRPDSLSSLASILSTSSGVASLNLSEKSDRQLSITSLTSFITNDDVTITPDSDEDCGIQLEISKKPETALPPLSGEFLLSGELNETTPSTEITAQSKISLRENAKTAVEMKKTARAILEHAPPDQAKLIQFSLQLLTTVGKVNDVLRATDGEEIGRVNYPPLYNASEFGGFHYRNIFRRWQDCFCNPINSAATDMISLMERKFKSSFSSKYELTGESENYINLGSYNYLGFGGVGTCSQQAEIDTRKYGIENASVRLEVGTQKIHVQLENLVAEFLGVEDAITFGMGFATNSTNLPGIVDRDCLVLSDRMNHASIILGMRLSGATVRVFEHNDMMDLERHLVKAVTEDKRRWRKVLIVVEGVYSMEGSLVQLPEIIELKRRFGAYLYLDEAHSIGAVGLTGRGVIEYFGCDPADVDVLMGTFTKSFGAAGGYIGGSKRLINHLRACSHSAAYATAMPPAVCSQVIGSMRIIMGYDGSTVGQTKISTLARNSQYFRRRLRQMGFIVYGDESSPVVPLMSFFVSKTAALYRRLKEFGIATAVIAYPATPLNAARARFCLSASHSKQQLDYVLDTLDRLGDELEIKYSQLPRCLQTIHY